MNHFENLQKLKSMPRASVSFRRPSLVPITKRNSIIKDLLIKNRKINLNENDEQMESKFAQLDIKRRFSKLPESRKLSLQQSLHLPQQVLTNIKKTDDYINKLSELEEITLRVCPKIEKRIICIKDKNVNSFKIGGLKTLK
jgi:hypothetical protein